MKLITGLPSVFERYRSVTESELKAILADRHFPLYDMMKYHLGWIDEKGRVVNGLSGKAVRPSLCLLACEAVSGEYQRALPAAAAIELVHNFSLIHDDIQDDDRERRHRLTVWSIWGKPQAINAGTAMRILAGLALLRLKEHNIPIQKQLLVQHIIDESSLTLIEGQYLDISYESRFDIGVTDYLEMISKKTASLIATAMYVGALLGTEDETLAKSFRDIGRNLGLAFQIKDDIFGIWGDEVKTGKPLGSDVKHRKKTFPVVYALEKATVDLREELIDVYSNGGIERDGVGRVMSVLDAVGAQYRAQRMAEKYCCEAMKSIDKLNILPLAKQDLRDVAQFLAERNF